MNTGRAMKRAGVIIAILAVGLGWTGVAGELESTAFAQEPPAPKRLFYEAAYVRETTDRAWTVRFGTGVMSRPGCFVIIHDAAGRLFIKHHVPYQGRTANQPQILRIPADGITGDYRIIFVGFQNDSYGLDLPLTDLPMEVYGRTHFATHRAAPLFMRAAPGVKELTFSSHAGGVRVLHEDKTVADTTSNDPQGPRFRPASFIPKPGAVYQVDPYGCFYFSSTTPVFLTFDAALWFVPDQALDDVKWWQLIARPQLAALPKP